MKQLSKKLFMPIMMLILATLLVTGCGSGGGSSTSSSSTGGSWTVAIIDNWGRDLPVDSSIAVDSSNKVHISYGIGGTNIFQYITNTSGSWVKTSLDNAGVGSAIALDSNDKIYISYAHNGIKYQTNLPGYWLPYTVDSSGYNTASKMAIDSNNKLHFSFSPGVLKYATNVTGSWIIYTIDNSTYVGSYNSLAIDSNNKVHISYYDYTNKALKYATNATGTWVTSTIDNINNPLMQDVGLYNSIAVDSNNKVHISYHVDDYYSGTLKYATNTSGSWATSVVDGSQYSISGPNAGMFSSIAVDAGNKVHISYLDYTNNALKYATNSSGTWIAITVKDSGVLGDTSIAVDSNHKVHISFSSYSGILYYLTYATK